VHIKHNQPQVLSSDSHLTIDTIHQTQNAANVLGVWRHYSRHSARLVVLNFFVSFTLQQNQKFYFTPTTFGVSSHTQL